VHITAHTRQYNTLRGRCRHTAAELHALRKRVCTLRTLSRFFGTLGVDVTEVDLDDQSDDDVDNDGLIDDDRARDRGSTSGIVSDRWRAWSGNALCVE